MVNDYYCFEVIGKIHFTFDKIDKTLLLKKKLSELYEMNITFLIDDEMHFATNKRQYVLDKLPKKLKEELESQNKKIN